jgi:hypothetical protein
MQREPGSENGYLDMKYIMLAALTALALVNVATAHAENQRSPDDAAQPAYSRAGNSVASLTALLAEWDRAGFVAPSKPGQYRVYGRNGYVTSGPGYNAMVSLIRSAVNDAQRGHDQDAARKIARAQSLLAASNSRPG